MKSTKHQWILFIIITLVQVAIIAFWGSKKENLYWDEYYTLEGAHYFSNSNHEEHYIDEDPDFNVGEWMPVSFIKDTLIVGENETLLKEPIVNVIKKLTGYHNYSAFLNIAESILSLGAFSIWPAIILNILFFILSQIVLYALCKKLSKNEGFPLAVCVMYGFSSICVSMAIFIRCYMLATLLVCLFTFLHLQYFETDGDELKARCKRIALMVAAFVTLYVVHNIAQYSVVYGGLFVITFAILLAIRKGIKRFMYYFLPMFIGGFGYLYTQTEYLKILFDHKDSYNDSNAALGSTLDGIVDFKLEFLPTRVTDMAHILGRYLFGSFFVLLIFVAIAIIMVFVHKFNTSNNGEKEFFSPFMVVSSTTAIAYIVIFTVFGLYEQVRYISFVFPELAIFVMVIAYNTFRNNKYKNTLVVLLIVVTALGVNLKGKVDMLYTGDRTSIEKIREFDADSYLLNTGNHRTFMMYETAFVAEDDDEFFVYDELEPGAQDNLIANLRDKMIFVGYYGVSTQDLQNILIENGYQIDWIADTYNYVFYTVVRN